MIDNAYKQGIMKKFILLAAVAAVLAACGPKVGPEPVGKRADALDASAWDISQWISAVNAPERVISDETGDRAADGARGNHGIHPAAVVKTRVDNRGALVDHAVAPPGEADDDVVQLFR